MVPDYTEPERRHDPEDAGAADVPDRVMLPLLDRITQDSLDGDYQHVAERKRARAGEGPRREGSPLRRRGVLTALVVGSFGILVSVSAVQTAEDADIASAGRATLIERITDIRETVDDQQHQISDLQGVNASLDTSNRSLDQQQGVADSQHRALAVESGFEEMRGDGVVAVVDDAPSGGDGMVRDRDLRLLINGLWEAGAQGVSVNGQRVTSLSALRNSWQAVRINDVSLSPPYRVRAVGDQDTLQARFAETSSGLRFQDLTVQLGMPFSLDNADDLVLPPAPQRLLDLRKVRTKSGGDPKQTGDGEEAP